MQLQLPVQQVDERRVCVAWTGNCSSQPSLFINGKNMRGEGCADMARDNTGLALQLRLQCGNQTSVAQDTFWFPPVLCSPASFHVVDATHDETHVEVRWSADNVQSTSQVHQWLVRNDTQRAVYIGASGAMWRDRVQWTSPTHSYVAFTVFDVAYASCPQQTFVVERPLPPLALERWPPWQRWAQTGATVACVCAVLWSWLVLSPFCLVVADSAWHVLLGIVCWWTATLCMWRWRDDKHLFPRPATWIWLQQRMACQVILLLCTALRDFEFVKIAS
jgi:hypothetical protein